MIPLLLRRISLLTRKNPLTLHLSRRMTTIRKEHPGTAKKKRINRKKSCTGARSRAGKRSKAGKGQFHGLFRDNSIPSFGNSCSGWLQLLWKLWRKLVKKWNKERQVMTCMNYLTIINAFWDWATTNPLSTGQVSLYFALLHVCNKSNWTEWFQAPNQVLSVLTGLSRSGILKARNELKQKGLIDFKERGTKATLYKLIIANSKQKRYAR